MTGCALHFPHVVGEALFAPLAICFLILALNVGDDSLKTRGVLDVPTKAVAITNHKLKVVSVQHGVLDRLRQLRPRGIERKVQLVCKTAQKIAEVAVKPLA